MMGKRLVMVAVAVVILAATTVGLSLAQGSNAAARGSDGVIHVVVGPDVRTEFFDFNHDGLTFGDRLAAVGPILDQTQTKRVGTSYADCLIVSRSLPLKGGAFGCTYVLKFADGDITTQGIDPHGPSDVMFSVTGGTGAYRDATGEAEYIDTSVTDIIIHLDDQGARPTD
jgi:hypothetical protein